MSDSEWSTFLSDVGRACESWPHERFKTPRRILLISLVVYVLAVMAYLIQNYASISPEYLAGTQPLFTNIIIGLTIFCGLIEIGCAYMYHNCLKKFRQVMTSFVDDRKDAMHARGIQLQFLYESRYCQGSLIQSGGGSEPGSSGGKMHHVRYKLYQWLQLDVIQPV